MTTTGKSESMKAYFDGYLDSNTMLNEFVVHYNKAVHARREAEKKEDFQTMQMQANLSGTHTIERVARDRYSQSVFKKFQTEFIASNSCTHETLNKDACSGW